MGAPCHNTTHGITLLQLLQFCRNWESSSLCFLCHMQTCCKIRYVLNTLSSNCCLLQFEFNFHVVFTMIRYARRCYTSLMQRFVLIPSAGRVYPEPPTGRFAIFQAFFPLDLLTLLLPACTHAVHAFQIE